MMNVVWETLLECQHGMFLSLSLFNFQSVLLMRLTDEEIYEKTVFSLFILSGVLPWHTIKKRQVLPQTPNPHNIITHFPAIFFLPSN